jgi:site-specific recombinase XerD
MPTGQISPVSSSPDLERLIKAANRFIHSAKAPATVKAYRSDWRDFEAWCYQHRLTPLPATPETVALYIADRAATLQSGTITRRLTSITKAHQAAGFSTSPASTRHMLVGETLKGIRRTIGTRQKGKDPLLTEDIRRIVVACPNNLLGLRDRSLVLVGFAGGFRRSELARIEFHELTFGKNGVIVHLPTSKTDQQGAGRKVGLPFGTYPQTCPVHALQRWLNAAAIADGPVFRSVNRHQQVSKRGLYRDSIGPLLKRAAARAGMETKPLAGHSLRAGLVTQAVMNGVSEFVIMKQTGHRAVATLQRYVRMGKIFTENAATGLGI